MAVHTSFRINEKRCKVKPWLGEMPVEVQAKHHPLSNSYAVCLFHTVHYVFYECHYIIDCIGCAWDLNEPARSHVLCFS